MLCQFLFVEVFLVKVIRNDEKTLLSGSDFTGESGGFYKLSDEQSNFCTTFGSSVASQSFL